MQSISLNSPFSVCFARSLSFESLWTPKIDATLIEEVESSFDSEPWQSIAEKMAPFFFGIKPSAFDVSSRYFNLIEKEKHRFLENAFTDHELDNLELLSSTVGFKPYLLARLLYKDPKVVACFIASLKQISQDGSYVSLKDALRKKRQDIKTNTLVFGNPQNEEIATSSSLQRSSFLGSFTDMNKQLFGASKKKKTFKPNRKFFSSLKESKVKLSGKSTTFIAKDSKKKSSDKEASSKILDQKSEESYNPDIQKAFFMMTSLPAEPDENDSTLLQRFNELEKAELEGFQF